MSKINIEEMNYGNWGKCIKISNEIIDLIATLDFGPRIIRFGFVGKENMFFEDINYEATNNSESMKIFNKGTWKLYGGHRLWASPEGNPRTYYPDNDKVQYEKLENGILLKPEEEVWTQIQKEIEIVLDENSSKVKLIHRITNKGAWSIKFAPWALSVMAKGGKEVIPQPKRETGLLGNRVIALWPYSKMNDRRVYWGENYIILNQDPMDISDFKLGINNEAGWAAYFNFNSLFIKKYEHNINGEYPDFGVSYETFTKHLFLEMESIGELKTVNTGETLEHSEQWCLYDNVIMPSNDECKIGKILNNYI